MAAAARRLLARVLFGGLALPLDPGVTVLLSAIMALSMRGVLLQSTHVLLEGTISREESDAVHRAIRQIPGV